MIYQYGVLFLVVTCMTMTSALPPCVCTKEMKPVCGSDGKTYNNECLLKCERFKNKDLILSSVGTCDVAPGSCVCTLEYAPICGTDSVTYPNSCSFECDRGEATLAYRGECRSKRESPSITSKPPCVCSREARQVCGTDGNTYNNPCMLNCAKEVTENLELDHVGRCVSEKQEIDPQQLPTCACTRNFQPVCASNGVTYSNKCLMRCAGADLTVEKVGPCITKQKIEDSSF